MARYWRWLLQACCVVLLLAPIAGHAADDEAEEADFSRDGAYVRASGQVAWTTSQQGFPVPLLVSWEPEFGLDVTLGWRNSERIGVETEFEWITNTEGAEYGSWLLGANLKYYVLKDRIQPYLIGGINGTWTKVPGATDSLYDWSFRNGIGVDYYLTRHWALSSETTFVWGVGDLWNNYFLTFGVGAMYRF